MIINNLKFYVIWMIPYSLINFVMFGRFIVKYNYFTLYTFFFKIGWAKRMIDYLGPWLAPPAFMFHHFCFFFYANILGIISFYNYYFGHFIAIIFFTITVRRGAHLYIKGISARLDI